MARMFAKAFAPSVLFGALVSAAAPAAAGDCPDYSLYGKQMSYTGEELWEPQVLKVVAGGPVDLGACMDVPGSGFVSVAPDFTIELTANKAKRDVEFRVDSTCDATLLVNDPQTGWHFDDDGNGNLDPKVRLSAAATGIYDVWIGTIDPQTCSALLTVETF